MSPAGDRDFRKALGIALDASTALVERVPPGRLRLAAPSCPGWSVRDVIGHSIGVTVKFTAFAAGVTDRPRTPEGDLLGGDHMAAFRAAATAASECWTHVDAARTCRLPFGSFPAGIAAGINLFDLLAHAWDIEVAVGEPFTCPDEVWATGLRAARQVIGAHRDPRHFAAALRPGSKAMIRTRFLNYLGRDPDAPRALP